MSKGDTTVHVDFEVGGASAAKMTVMDVYRAQQANASKLNEAARALSKEQGITFSDAKKAIREYVKQTNSAANEIAAANRAADAKATADAATAIKKQEGLEKEAARKTEKLLDEERRAQRRASEMAVSDAKWEAREKVKEAKRVAREKERELKMEQSQRGAMNKLMGRGLWGAAMGVAGYAGVAGVSAAASSQFSAATNSADRRSEMEKAITPVVALGDNVNKMAAIRAEVVGLAAILGKSNQEVGAFMEAVDSISNTMAADRLADIKKETVELTNLAGGDLRDNFNMLAKTQIIFGDAFESANQIQNKMYKVQSDTVSSMQEFSQRMPDLMAAGKALGLTVDEISAAAVSATTVGGTAEKAFTGARTSFVAMEKAKDKGIPLTGTLVEQLQQLSDAAKAGKIDLLEIFQGEGITSGFGIVDQLDKVRENIKKFQEIGPNTDTVGDNLAAKYQDRRFSISSLRDLDKSILENAPNISADLGIENPMTQLMARFRTGKIAGAAVSDGMFGAPTAFGIAAALGHKGVLSVGNKVRLGYTSETAPFRDSLINEQMKYEFDAFENKKIQDIDALGYDHKASAALGNYFGYDGRSAEMKAIEERNFDFNSSRSNMPSLEGTVGRVSIAEDLNVNQREANKILAEIRDRLAPRSSTTMKPGGGTTNNSEL